MAYCFVNLIPPQTYLGMLLTQAFQEAAELLRGLWDVQMEFGGKEGKRLGAHRHCQHFVLGGIAPLMSEKGGGGGTQKAHKPRTWPNSLFE